MIRIQNKHYTPRIGNNSKEFVLTAMSNISNTVEKSIETILIDNEETKKLSEAPPKKEKVEKPKLTKEERAIKKAKEKARDELYNLTMKKMFSGLI